jgi:hypothetical protein
MKYLGIRRPEVSLTLAPADIQYDNLIDLENIEKLDEIVINNSNLPIGGIIQSYFKDDLVGFKDCNGQKISKSIYPELYNVIGDTFHPASQDLKLDDQTINQRLLYGQPWKNQYNLNPAYENLERKVATFHSYLPKGGAAGAYVVTKNRVYLFGLRLANNAFDNNIYVAFIDEDGDITNFESTGNTVPYSLLINQAIIIGKTGYIFGSYHATASSSTNNILKFEVLDDGSISNLTTLSGITSPVTYSYNIALIGNRVYIFGGVNNVAGTYVNSQGVYYSTLVKKEDGTLELSSFVLLNNLPAISNRATLVVTNNYVYLIGGNSAPANTMIMSAKILENNVLDSWMTQTLSNGYTSYASIVYVTNKNIYLIGGINSGYTMSNGQISNGMVLDINDDGLLSNGRLINISGIPSKYALAFQFATKKYLYFVGGFINWTGAASAPTNNIYRVPLTFHGSVGRNNYIDNLVELEYKVFDDSVISNLYVDTTERLDIGIPYVGEAILNADKFDTDFFNDNSCVIHYPLRDNTKDVFDLDFNDEGLISTVNLIDIFNDGSCKAYYTFNDANAADSTGNFHGTETDIVYNPDGRNVGEYTVISSATSQINCGIPHGTATTVTISAWIKWNGNNSVMPFGFYLYDLWFYGGNFGFNSGNTDLYGTNSTILANTWKHVVVQFNTGSYGKIWVDGVPQILTQTKSGKTILTANAVVASKNFYIFGREYDAGYRNFGEIDHIRMINRSVTDEEAGILYEEKKNTFNLDTYYSTAGRADIFNDGSNVITYNFEADSALVPSILDLAGTTSATQINVNFEPGRFAQVAKFNGTSSYIDTNYILPAINKFSFSCWFKTSSTANQAIWSDDAATSSIAKVRAGLTIVSSKFFVALGNNTTGWSDNTVSATKYLDGKWHHVVLTVNGTALLLYVDGLLIKTFNSTIVAGTAGTQSYKLGKLGAGSTSYFNGSLEQFRFFNKTLNSTEIYQLFNENLNPVNRTIAAGVTLVTDEKEDIQVLNIGLQGSYVTRLNNYVFPQSYTIALSFKSMENTLNKFYPLISNKTTDAISYKIGVYNSKVVFQYNGTTIWSFGNINPDTWYHIAISKDKVDNISTYKFYVNGFYYGSVANTITGDNFSCIGHDTTNLFVGRISNFRVFNRDIDDTIYENDKLFFESQNTFYPQNKAEMETIPNGLPLPLLEPIITRIQDYVYLIGGSTSTATNLHNKIYRAKITDGELGQFELYPLLYPLSIINSVAIVIQNKLIVYGGRTATSTYTPNGYMIDINTDGSLGTTWVQLPSLPIGISNGSFLIKDNILYYVNTFNGSTLSTIYYTTIKQNGVIDNWSTHPLTLPNNSYSTYGKFIVNASNEIFYHIYQNGINGKNDIYKLNFNEFNILTGFTLINTISLPSTNINTNRRVLSYTKDYIYFTNYRYEDIEIIRCDNNSQFSNYTILGNIVLNNGVNPSNSSLIITSKYLYFINSAIYNSGYSAINLVSSIYRIPLKGGVDYIDTNKTITNEVIFTELDMDDTNGYFYLPNLQNDNNHIDYMIKVK